MADLSQFIVGSIDIPSNTTQRKSTSFVKKLQPYHYDGMFWCRKTLPYGGTEILCTTPEGYTDRYSSLDPSVGLCPSFLLNTSQTSAVNLDTIQEVKSETGEILYHTIQLGEYPQSVVDRDLAYRLEALFNNGALSEEIICTGRLFTSNGFSNSSEYFASKQSPEFEYNGERYVRVYNNTAQWVKVEPISFIVENYDEFIQGNTTELKLTSEKILLSSLPFSMNSYYNPWETSCAYAFLNSTKNDAWDFSNSGFLQQALNTTRESTTQYTIPASETIICQEQFAGCVGIKQIIVPPHVTEIKQYAFKDCPNAQIVLQAPVSEINIDHMAFFGLDIKYIYLSKNGDHLILSQTEDRSLEENYIKRPYNSQELEFLLECISDENFRANVSQISNWKQEGKISFIPPYFTLKTIPHDQMENYLIKSNQKKWGSLVQSLQFDTLEEPEKHTYLTSLMKIYYALGGFSADPSVRDKAFKYIVENVAVSSIPDATPYEVGKELHKRFSKIELSGQYNPTFAKFFMRHYHTNPDFMRLTRSADKVERDYLCIAHNCFLDIQRLNPHRVVEGNTINQLLSPQFVADHCILMQYKNVLPGNELLAKTIGSHAYSQEVFETMQNLYEEVKAKKPQPVLRLTPRTENGVSYRLLDKEDPLGFVIGDLTNCCQRFTDKAQTAVIDGYLNENAGFLVFEQPVLDELGNPTSEKVVIAQAYVWYDPKTHTVCYDNIEIPHAVLEKFQNAGTLDQFLDIVIESARGMIYAMRKAGIQVDQVTTGENCNDLKESLEARFGKPKVPKAAHRGYEGYSDAENGQYLLRDYERDTDALAKFVLEICDELLNELNKIATLDFDKKGRPNKLKKLKNLGNITDQTQKM